MATNSSPTNAFTNEPAILDLIAAARADPSTLQPNMASLAAKEPRMLQLVQQNQAEFLSLLNGAETIDAAPVDATAAAPIEPPAAAAPSEPPAAAAPVEPPTAASAAELPITLLYKGAQHKLVLDTEDSVDVFRFQVFSLTDVPPEEQQITGLGPGQLRDDADLAALGVAPGTWASLTRRAKAPPPAPMPAPAPAPAAVLPTRSNPAADEQARMEMEGRLASGFQTSRAHADPRRQAEARAVVPWAALCEKAGRTADADGDAATPPGEAELKQLLRWFKHEFFKWVDKPACEETGAPTESAGMGAPTAEERAGGAGRVELYRGPTGHITRFPRYNDPSVLLRTRRGRCGEWANCFGLVLRAVGYESRWVLDVTDHVWCEVRLPEQDRWVHCDPCEEALDAPLMYEQGWGKKLSYVFAFGPHEVVDAARRYSRRWEQTLARRTAVKEGWLELTIHTLNETRQAALPPAERAALAERAAREQQQLAKRHEARALSQAERQGRTTGSVAWRSARGELGETGGQGGGGGCGSGGGGGEEGGAGRHVARVCGAAGGAVHGLCFEAADGARWGAFLENSKELIELGDDAALARRGGRWERLEPGEAIVAVRGRGSTMGYLCAEIVLCLSSGRELTFAGCVDESQPRIEARAPDGEVIVGLEFDDGDLIGVTSAAWKAAEEPEEGGGS